MDYLLKDRRQFVGDALLQVSGQVFPDVGGMSGHRTSQSSATMSNSFTASKVSLVEAGGRVAASVVEAKGMRKTM
jgi:hypothetical protein